ncbi:MAG: cytochrome P450, partial [Dietzia sp.]|nr:cytochrome P450 [Dietzia sp.]
MAVELQQRIRWLALHGVIRGLSKVGARRDGDPQARLIADPAVRDNPAAFADEMRDRGPLIRCRAVLLTVNHRVASELLRSDDFRVTMLGGGLPAPLRWVNRKTHPGLLHPIEPPSLLSIEPPDHTRCRKLVSSV